MNQRTLKVALHIISAAFVPAFKYYLLDKTIKHKDEKGRKYKFITNNWEIRPEEVALIYKYRWTIELTFKKTETKLSTALLLLGSGKRDKDTGLVHADCPFAIKRGAGLVRGAKRRFQPLQHWCGYT